MTGTSPARGGGADRRLFIGANVANSGGTLPYAWTRSATAATDPHDPVLWRRIAETLERGVFHAFFLGDIPHPVGRPDTTLSKLEPTTLLARLAAQTSGLGFATTISSSLNEPFEIARKIHTLQRLSGGRFAVNIVTTAQREPYQNFGIDEVPARPERYARAVSFVEELIDHWARIDAGAGLPLHLLQAGGSPQGVALAAERADAVYGSASTRDYSAGLRSTLRSLATGFGRREDDILFVPGVNVTIGATQAEAEQLFDRYAGGFDSETATARLSDLLGVSLAGLSQTSRIPEELLVEALEGTADQTQSIAHRRSFITLIRELDEPLSDVIRRVDLNGSGHLTFVGTAERLAELIRTWFRTGAADGFIIRPQSVPHDLEAFVDTVVPLLQESGDFHREYGEGFFAV